MTASNDWGAAFMGAGSNDMQFYDDVMVPRMFAPWAELLLDQIELAPGAQMLDVATGPGTVARIAAARVGPSGRVVACDLSPAMLAIAEAKPPVDAGAPIEYQECPADALPVSDDAFDVATCQQGLQFFPDKLGALAEIRRSVHPGGRVAAAVWCTLEECPPFAALERGLAAVVGDTVAAGFRNGPWGLTDADALAALFEEAGCTDIRVTRHELPLVFEGGILQLMSCLAAAPVAAAVAELDDMRRHELFEMVKKAAAPLMRDGAVESSAAAHIVLANA